MTERDLMMAAVEITRTGIKNGQSPFGAVIVKEQSIIASTHNTVWRTCDPTAHAEVNCIREASKVLKTIDLSGYEMFTTCEPCPMCLTAIHWAKLDRVVYGATIEDAASADFQELKFSAEELARKGGSSLKVEHGPYRDICAGLFQEWKQAKLSKSY